MSEVFVDVGRPSVSEPSRGPSDVGSALWIAMRPRQSIKNVLVFAAPVAAGTVLGAAVAVPCLIVFVAMCAAASSTYLTNDLTDRHRDRLHPTKCRRPIASGALPEPAARTAAVVLGCVALALAWSAGIGPLAVVASYLALTNAYSRRIKHVPYLELVVVASGFVLRVLVGAMASSTHLSVSFMVVIGAGSLLLATGKRIAELVHLGERAGRHRPVLLHYRRSRLGVLVSACSTVMAGAYASWAWGGASGQMARPFLIVSIVPMILASVHLAHAAVRGDTGDPTELIAHDRLLRVVGGAVGVCVLAATHVA